MSNSFIQAVEDEIVMIEEKIKHELDRLEELKIVRKVYAEKTEKSAQAPLFSIAPIALKNDANQREESVSARVITYVQQLLSDGRRQKIHELLLQVTEHGIIIGGANQATGLSAILSRRKDIFSGDKKLGWTLTCFVNENGESVV